MLDSTEQLSGSRLSVTKLKSVQTEASAREKLLSVGNWTTILELAAISLVGVN
jgi:hypothetical protein